MAARRASTSETPTTPRTTARQAADVPVEDTGRKCVRKGCHHVRSQHVVNGTTCWGKVTCPCTGYAGDRSVLKAEETEAEPNVPIPGGPETGITMSAPAAPEDDATGDGRDGS